MMVRYWCVVGPGPAGDLGHACLSQLADRGFLVRAVPIGPYAMGVERRWFHLSGLFATPQAVPFLNVVCAPAGLELGRPVNVRAFADHGTLPAQLAKALGTPGESPDRARLDDVIYQPQTALAQLHTARTLNIALVVDTGEPDNTSSLELEAPALAKYDLVVAGSWRVRALLFEHGIVAPLFDADTIATTIDDFVTSKGSFISHAPKAAAPPVAITQVAKASRWQRARLAIAAVVIRIRNRLFRR
jgi:hypothetical protein